MLCIKAKNVIVKDVGTHMGFSDLGLHPSPLLSTSLFRL